MKDDDWNDEDFGGGGWSKKKLESWFDKEYKNIKFEEEEKHKMLGKFYVDQITKVPGSTREVLPVVLHKDTLKLTKTQLRTAINDKLKHYGYRLSKFHKEPFKIYPDAICFRKNYVATGQYGIDSYTDLIWTKDMSQTIYFVVSKLT